MQGILTSSRLFQVRGIVAGRGKSMQGVLIRGRAALHPHACSELVLLLRAV